MNELKKCPFCSGRARYFIRECLGIRVECEICHISTAWYDDDKNAISPRIDEYAIDKCTRDWNTRVSERACSSNETESAKEEKSNERP